MGWDYFFEMDFTFSSLLLSADLIRSCFCDSITLMSELTVFIGSRVCGGLNIGVRVYEVTSRPVSGFGGKTSEFGR